MPVTCARSWAVAVTCGVLNFLHLGTARLSGSLYLAVLQRYPIDRSKASLPFILCYTVRNISGPLVGYLARKFGIYTVTILGGIIASIGIGGCYFAEDIGAIIFLWGVVFGFGFGMGSVLIPEILNQHFDKYVSNANGIALGGECIAGFVLPIYLKFSLNAYGMSCTFLILSSLILNSIPAALLLRHFSRLQLSEGHQRAEGEERLSSRSKLRSSINGNVYDFYELEDEIPFETTELLVKRKSNLKSSKAEVKPMSLGSAKTITENEVSTGNIENREMNSDKFKEHPLPYLKQRIRIRKWEEDGKNAKLDEQTTIQIQTSSNQEDTKPSASKDTVSHSHPEQNRKYNLSILSETNTVFHSKSEKESVSSKSYGSFDQAIKNFGNISEEMTDHLDKQTSSYEKSMDNLTEHDVTQTSPSVPMQSLLASSSQTLPSNPFKIFLDPAFCAILLTQSTMLYNATMFWTVIVDFTRDTGLSSKEEIYILVCLSVSDMVGRLGLGWISDVGYLSNSTFSGICCFCMGISVGSLVFIKKFAAIGCSVSVFGLFLGGFLIVCPGMVNDHIHQNKRGMALASRFFLFAPMSLTQSPLIGFFRGKLGSYISIFIIVAVLCLLSSITSLVTPYAERFRERRTNRSNRILRRNLDAFVPTSGSMKVLAN